MESALLANVITVRKVKNMKIASASPALARGFSATHEHVDDAPMTLRGAVEKSALLLAVLVFSAAVASHLPIGALVPPALVAFVLAMVTVFKPRIARMTAIPYAVCEGAVVGLVSKLYAQEYGGGLVVFAVGITFAILGALLFVYRTGLIPVTQNFRLGVAAATLGIVVYYLAALLFGVFGVDVPLVASTSWLGIAFSLLVVLLASANLVIDFDFIEKGAERGYAKHMEWYAAFGLLVTLVWLYLEILRLLAKLQSRRN